MKKINRTMFAIFAITTFTSSVVQSETGIIGNIYNSACIATATIYSTACEKTEKAIEKGKKALTNRYVQAAIVTTIGLAISYILYKNNHQISPTNNTIADNTITDNTITDNAIQSSSPEQTQNENLPKETAFESFIEWTNKLKLNIKNAWTNHNSEQSMDYSEYSACPMISNQDIQRIKDEIENKITLATTSAKESFNNYQKPAQLRENFIPEENLVKIQ